MSLILNSRDEDRELLEGRLIGLSRSERWAWDAVNAMSQAALRNPSESLSPVLRTWVADMLAGNEPRPRVRGKRLANRDLAIADAIALLCEIYGLKPTRSLRGHPECYAEGGSACDVVGVAAGMTYKAVERIWTEWGTVTSKGTKRKIKDILPLGPRRLRPEFWPADFTRDFRVINPGQSLNSNRVT